MTPEQKLPQPETEEPERPDVVMFEISNDDPGRVIGYIVDSLNDSTTYCLHCVPEDVNVEDGNYVWKVRDTHEYLRDDACEACHEALIDVADELQDPALCPDEGAQG